MSLKITAILGKMLSSCTFCHRSADGFFVVSVLLDVNRLVSSGVMDGSVPSERLGGGILGVNLAQT